MNKDYSAKWWAAFISITIIEAILLYMLISRQASELIVVAIIAIAFLLFLFPKIEDVLLLTFDRGRLETKLNSINKKVATNKTRVDKYYMLAIPKQMYETLKKLASNSYGPYQMSEVLERDVYHLRDIGYIDAGRIRDIPYEGTNLSTYVKITDAGKQFVEMRKGIEEENSK
ncbi:MAG: hypothetical protein PUP91_33875 [Rhizonema sp. PD37]|nr:hypothetical protein [Rhizonema sp. PD37]